MAGVATDESGTGMSFDGVSSGQQQLGQSGEALAEWRSLEQVENGIPSTSPPYWDSDDDDDGGQKPSDLYGKYTWKIDKFSQINKRELRSNAFEVGGYKWYILIYPQGCDVCNHLSLFLCVANHDKLLPGWSHFAQFTIAVVNKDPKKSKYSDTLHRFWKKEHDWGWKKFMELSKVLDGFIDADTLIIKAQVQVIRERADRPFRCLDCQYRRELVRVYLTNVEQICRRFVEERRAKLGKLIEDKPRWASFCGFWMAMDQNSRRRMSRERAESILKVVVKSFFIEKEVTSTLVMDSLYSGLKALEGQSNGKKSKGKNLEAEELPAPIVHIEKDTFVLMDDVLLLLERAALEPLPPKDEKGPQNRTKDGAAGEEFNKDSIERDERRLTELGRRTIEIFVLAHIFSKIEVAYQEAVALKRQEELIREEEAAWLAESELKTKRGPADKEKKSKKKQGKQKKNNRKVKDKGKEDKLNSVVLHQIEQDNSIGEGSNLAAEPEMILEKSDAVEVVSDVSDSVDCVPEILPPDSDDRDTSPVNWDTDTSEVHPSTEASSCRISGMSGVQNGVERRSPAVDDSSSTCSSDSVPSITLNVPHKGSPRNQKNQKSPTRARKNPSKSISESVAQPSFPLTKMVDVPMPEAELILDAYCEVVESLSQTSICPSQGGMLSAAELHVENKVEEPGLLHKNSSVKGAINVEVCGDKASSRKSPPRSPTKSIPSVTLKLESRINSVTDPVDIKKSSPDGPRQADRSVRSYSVENTNALKPDAQKVVAPKPAEKPFERPSGHQIPVGTEKPLAQHQASAVTTERPSMPPLPVMSRPLSAPLIPGPRPAVSMVSMVQTAPILARSVSATGRLGPEPTTSATQSFIPQSYRNAIIGSPVASSSSAYTQSHPASSSAYTRSHPASSSAYNTQHHPASSIVNPSLSYSQTQTLSYAQVPPVVSAPMFSALGSDRMDPNPVKQNYSYGMVNNHDVLQNGSLWMDSQRDNLNLTGDRPPMLNDLQSFDLYHPVRSRSHDHIASDFQAGTSGRQGYALEDEFPHLGIINDLLDDEYEIGKVARSNSGYRNFSDGPHHLNRQFSFPGDPGMSSGLGPSTSSCRFERSRSYLDDGFQHGYANSGNPYDMARDVIPQASQGPYMNGQIDGLMVSQWQMGGSDPPFLNVRNVDNDAYSYHHIPEYTNLATGSNGYGVFRPSNGL